MTRLDDPCSIGMTSNLLIRYLLLIAILIAHRTPLAAQDRQGGSDWPRFLGNTFDGVVAAVDPRIDFTAEPDFVWSIAVGDGYGMGSVVGNRYLQLDADEPTSSGGFGERLRCFRLDDGQPIWSDSQPVFFRDMLGYEDGPRSSPTVGGTRVFTLGVSGQLTCRDLEDGTVQWRVNTQEKYGVVQNFFGVGSSPLLLEDQLIVMVGGSPSEDHNYGPMRLDLVTPNGSAVVAFDPETGRELWKCGDDLASYSSPRPINIDGQTYVLVFAREGLMLIDPESGTVRWRFDHRASKLESVNAMVPVVVDDLVLISDCYEVGSALLKVSADRGELLWRDQPARRFRELTQQNYRSHWTTPIAVDGFLYGGNGRNAGDSDFRCIELKTGMVQWSELQGIRWTATRVGSHLLVLNEQGLLLVVKPNPQQLDVVASWRLLDAKGERPAIGYPCWAAPIVVGTKVILRGTDNVICLDMSAKPT